MQQFDCNVFDSIVPKLLQNWPDVFVGNFEFITSIVHGINPMLVCKFFFYTFDFSTLLFHTTSSVQHHSICYVFTKCTVQVNQMMPIKIVQNPQKKMKLD